MMSASTEQNINVLRIYGMFDEECVSYDVQYIRVEPVQGVGQIPFAYFLTAQISFASDCLRRVPILAQVANIKKFKVLMQETD